MLCPIEQYKDILLKRCDYYIKDKVNGGKLLQAEHLIKNNLKKIRGKYNNTVSCYCSIKSPQSAIISTVCKQYGLKCNIITYKTEKENINLSIAQKNKAFLYGFNCAYDSVLRHYTHKYFHNTFIINMGFEDVSIVNSIAEEVENLPDNLDYLIIPIGSAMNFIGILNGLKKYNKKVGKIIGVYVGRNPTDTLKKYYKGDTVFDIVKYNKSYGTEINIDNYYFDPIYEAKAYDWLNKNINTKKYKCLLWVIGKRNLDNKMCEKLKYTTVP